MYKKITSFSFYAILLMGSLQAELMQEFSEPTQLIIQNRVLTKVHNSTISVLDVVKRMDLFLHKHYPQYANSLLARHQYFSTQWKDTFLQMVDHELILADAEKMELKTTDSEIRELLFEKFGPNIMASLDTLNMSYEEARSMVHAELVVQKMTWFKVHSKALASVNSKDIQTAYLNYLQKNPLKELWEYQVLSIRAQEEQKAATIAEQIVALCKDNPKDLQSVVEEIKTSYLPDGEKDPIVQLSLSDLLATEDKNLSTSHKETLLLLLENSLSQPVKVTRQDQSIVYRIFYLQKHTQQTAPSLRSMHIKLQNQLVQEEVEKETREYILKLRKRYGFSSDQLEESVPSTFQPFSLQ